jgi:2,4-dienoyl-CoA reductase-like NADH-dependent reductase (Old Yellow Enzyme family)
MLFTATSIGTLQLPNRLLRSATAESLADDEGRPKPALAALYRELAEGGVGLIITGHMYVHPSGRAHPRMTGIHTDALIPALATLTGAVHEAGGRVAVQINHGGMKCGAEVVAEPLAPSDVEDAPFVKRPARAMTIGEIETAIDAYAQAARRAQEAGFDAVQLHGAHGYLINQFLSPRVNRRTDEWGGDLSGRMRFLRRVCEAVRAEVGPDYPVFIKLGMSDGLEGGLTPEDGAQVVAALAGMGLDGVEVSGGISGGGSANIEAGIRSPEEEAYFRPLARRAQAATTLSVALVGGLRSRSVMEDVLSSGDADLISLCRPLICEPGLPRRMAAGLQDRAACISGNRCWPEEDEGVACKCPVERDAA